MSRLVSAWVGAWSTILLSACLWVAILADCSCGGAISIDRPAIVPVGNPGDVCAKACAKLAANQCPSGLNANCASVCRNDQAQGAASMLDPQCIINASTVAQVVACGASCP
jgi:hypothetical protein